MAAAGDEVIEDTQPTMAYRQYQALMLYLTEHREAIGGFRDLILRWKDEGLSGPTLLAVAMAIVEQEIVQDRLSYDYVSGILRNIIAERVLGLPGEIRVDRDRPFKEIPSGS